MGGSYCLGRRYGRAQADCYTFVGYTASAGRPGGFTVTVSLSRAAAQCVQSQSVSTQSYPRAQCLATADVWLSEPPGHVRLVFAFRYSLLYNLILISTFDLGTHELRSTLGRPSFT